PTDPSVEDRHRRAPARGRCRPWARRRARATLRLTSTNAGPEERPVPPAMSDVLEGVAAVADGVAREDAARVDRERAFPQPTLDALAQRGAWGLLVPPEAGGAGGSLTALAQACATLGAACASSGMVFLMHSVTAATIAAGGGDR